ncbi:acyl-CoA thioesterase [Niallia circulans]|jgi:acyl-CoA thioester hydrolase|uniref:Thioesterase family protein n=2 Tax=Bacillales TaxID=1385 RepID=A0ABV1EYB6_9BACI|nr:MULTISPECIES: thioesterase family protein [Bacillaceae]MCF2647452.1 acyl-CoA thioesterase [Niallia circulans]MCM3364987.1 acyl-CoA thioesterase [Niallia sp. MER TA 168]CAI9385929.1 1,4-dihydroxy-2-naphthoyl-CoA hydrolase [Bacillus sp. T2.9-1]
MKQMDNFFISIRDIELYYADTDAMGVVYHANYLKFFERGRTGLIEDIGYDYLEMENKGYFAPVYDVYAMYKKPLRYGDQAKVKTWVETNDGIKTVYGYQIINQNEEICVEGTTTHIIVSKETFRPKPFKKIFPEWFHKYEEIKKQPTDK